MPAVCGMITESIPRATPEEGCQVLSAGTILQSRYRIVRELGAGGMGAVYEAIDQRLDATVAIKQTFSIDEQLRRQFEQEARLLAQLHHPSLPRVSDYFTEEGRAFLVMQFISGDDLAHVIARQASPFPTNQVIAWADQLLDALVYLHTRDRQIIHRDIKPHNLKLTEAGQIALLDFGLAKTFAADHSTTQSSHSIFGYTRRYSPIEQIQDQGTSPQSDIYALGATLYHLFTGAKPPDCLVRAAALAAESRDPLRPASELNSAISAELAQVLNRAMAVDAADRFASAREFREALRRLGRRAFEPESEAASRPRGNNAMATNSGSAHQSVSKVDPFDSYSILRPEQEVFRLARSDRRPAVFAVVLAVVLITISASFPSGVFNLALRLLSSTRSNATMRETVSAATLRQAKTEAAVVRPVPAKNGLVPPAAETNHAGDIPKRRGRHGTTKQNVVKPPPISITPE